MSKDTACIHEIVCNTVWQRELLEVGSPLVLMVSGGSDSIALLYLVYELRERLGLGPLRVVHVNHLLRGEASDDDEAFVCSISESLGIDCVVHRLDIPALAHKQGDNIEAAARHARYAAAEEELDELCHSVGIAPRKGRIAVAHTQNDQIESFYMRSIVGTGPGGFAGMAYRTRRIVRILMDLSREDLRDYLRRRALSDAAARPVDAALPAPELWREDATNADTEHFRSFVRHELIPRARIWNPRLEDTLCRTMNLIADEDAMLDTFVEQLMAKALAPAPGLFDGSVAEDGALALDCSLLGSYPLPILRRLAYKLVRSMLPAEMRLENQHVEKLVSGIRQLSGASVSSVFQTGSTESKTIEDKGEQNALHEAFSTTLPTGIQVCNEDEKLIFTPPLSNRPKTTGRWLDIPGRVELSCGTVLSAREVELDTTARRAIISADKNKAYIDLSATVYSNKRLWLRFFQTGDVMSPLGMDGRHKKVQDIFVDAKIPSRLRASIPLICEGSEKDARIIWLAGIALSDSFKVTPQTAKTVLLTLESSEGSHKVG